MPEWLTPHLCAHHRARAAFKVATAQKSQKKTDKKRKAEDEAGAGGAGARAPLTLHAPALLC